MIPTEQENKKYKTSIDDKNRNGKNGEVKVSYHYSCGKIKPKEKSQLNGKTTVATRRYNASTVKVNNISKKENKERKEGKEGKDSIIKMNTRNKNDNANTGNNPGSYSSYKKRNQKNNKSHVMKKNPTAAKIKQKKI